MRRTNRVSLIALLPLVLALGGCETSSFWDSANNMQDKFQDMMADFNPFGAGKKPLPGERRAVFPEGVPGVQQGVPPELMRGNQQAAETPAQPAPEAASEPKQKSKSKKVARTKTPPRAQPGAESSGSADDVWPPPPSGRQ
jgi:hypothetical protein